VSIGTGIGDVGGAELTGDSDTKTVKADGKVLINEGCKTEEKAQKGEICGAQGSEGVIYVEHVEVE
jgi:hypothetical protein